MLFVLLFIRPPGTVDPGRSCVLLQFFFSTRNLRGPLADRREILRHAWKHVVFYNSGPKIWGTAPRKILWAKNTLILAPFLTPFHFEREYLRKG